MSEGYYWGPLMKVVSNQNLTISEIARRTGVARSQIYRYLEDGGHSMSVKVIGRLAKGLNIKPCEFCVWKEGTREANP